MLSTAVAMAPIERQESRYVQVQTTKMRERCVRPVCKNEEEEFSSSPEYTFGICSVDYEESCFTGAFDPSQRRQIKLGSLLCNPCLAVKLKEVSA